MRGRDLTDGMTGQHARLDAPGLDQPEQRHLHREQRRLRPPRLIQRIRTIAEQGTSRNDPSSSGSNSAITSSNAAANTGKRSYSS